MPRGTREAWSSFAERGTILFSTVISSVGYVCMNTFVLTLLLQSLSLGQSSIPVPIITKFFCPLQVQVPAKLGGFLDGVGHFCHGNLEFCMSLLSTMRLFLHTQSIPTGIPKTLLLTLTLSAPVLLSIH